MRWGDHHQPQCAQRQIFVGSGKAEEIASQVQMLDADVVIFNHALTLPRSATWSVCSSAG